MEMKFKRFSICVFIVVLIVSFCGLWLGPKEMMVKAQGGHDPVLDGQDLRFDGSYYVFEVVYFDEDGDNGTVYVNVDDWDYIMDYSYGDPINGQYHECYIPESSISPESEFYFEAYDTDGNYTVLYDPEENPFVVSDYVNYYPFLEDPDVFSYGNEYVFEVFYWDYNADEAYVWVVIDEDEPLEMATWEIDPYIGQTYQVYIEKSEVSLDSEFYFYAAEVNDMSMEVFLPETYNFVVRDFIESDPVLSNPYVYFDGTDYVFNVTYHDPDGDIGSVMIFFSDTWDELEMSTEDTNALEGMNYQIKISPAVIEINNNTLFEFIANDENDGVTWLVAEGEIPFRVGDFPPPGEPSDGDGGDGENGGDGGDGGEGTKLGAGWIDNPEVMVGIIALVAVAGGSAYGVYRRKKKQGRFSDLLTDLDEVYKSYKMNPHKCEIELEKMRALVNEDLKKGVIDENNYSILKERIDELIREIRSDSLHTQVKDIPKELELRIKDMLIDGEISRAEYDKLLPIIMGSEMASEDKKRMEKVVESWMKEDEKGEDEK
jgi:hypothetical protein